MKYKVLKPFTTADHNEVEVGDTVDLDDVQENMEDLLIHGGYAEQVPGSSAPSRSPTPPPEEEDEAPTI